METGKRGGMAGGEGMKRWDRNTEGRDGSKKWMYESWMDERHLCEDGIKKIRKDG